MGAPLVKQHTCALLIWQFPSWWL